MFPIPPLPFDRFHKFIAVVGLSTAIWGVGHLYTSHLIFQSKFDELRDESTAFANQYNEYAELVNKIIELNNDSKKFKSPEALEAIGNTILSINKKALPLQKILDEKSAEILKNKSKWKAIGRAWDYAKVSGGAAVIVGLLAFGWGARKWMSEKSVSISPRIVRKRPR